MPIAIHHRGGSFSDYWIDYCNQADIPYALVNCYDSDIISQLADCDGLMWHFHHTGYRDIIFAKQLMYALGSCGYPVFPDWNTAWHFDDKLGQMYLLEAAGAPLVPSYVFYTKPDATDWINRTEFPRVFKLRGGASSENVRLVKDKKSAKKLVKLAFGAGFRQYEPLSKLKERLRKFDAGHSSVRDVSKGVIRLFHQPPYAKIKGRDKGYIYFQDFIPDNEYDIRINVIAGKAFGSRRKVRPNDFRSSGSGISDFDVRNIPLQAVRTAIDLAGKLKLQSVAFDFLMQENRPLIVEMSYGFGIVDEILQQGYWDEKLNFHTGAFNPFGWMVELMLETIARSSSTGHSLQVG